MEKYILLPIYLLLTTSGMVLIKLGGNAGTFAVKDGNLTIGMNLISLLGLICYIVSFLMYVRIISLYDLSYIYPICTAIVQILTLIASTTILREKLSVYGIIGVGIIIVGIIVMNINAK